MEMQEDSFSFSSTPNQEDSEFEFRFGSLIPYLPSCKTSPADYLFLNGRLQPHSFPLSFASDGVGSTVATTSQTSSIGSKDSLLSSRSNSTNSSCSSARTSSSDSSERRLFQNASSVVSLSGCPRHHRRPLGCSQRWLYITPLTTLYRDASKRRRQVHQQTKEKKKKTIKVMPLRFGRRIFRWFFTTCRQCHAMEPSKAHKKPGF